MAHRTLTRPKAQPGPSKTSPIIALPSRVRRKACQMSQPRQYAKIAKRA